MVKSAVELLATDKKFKNGFLAGMILAKKIATEKKNATQGGKKIKGGSFSFKKALAIAAGPLGWVWLARHKNDEELNKVKKKLEKYEPPKKSKKEKEMVDEFPDDDDDDDDDDEYGDEYGDEYDDIAADDDFPMENVDDDYDLDDFQ